MAAMLADPLWPLQYPPQCPCCVQDRRGKNGVVNRFRNGAGRAGLAPRLAVPSPPIAPHTAI